MTITKTKLDILTMLANGCVIKCWGNPELSTDAWVSRPEVESIRAVKRSTVTSLLYEGLISVLILGTGDHAPNGITILKITPKGKELAAV